MTHKLYFLLILVICTLQACGGIKQIEKKTRITTTPTKLELFVNQKTDPYIVPIYYVVHIPANYIPACARLIYTPRLVTPEKEYILSPLIITGEKFHRWEKRHRSMRNAGNNYAKATLYTANNEKLNIPIHENVPFQLWMPQAKLVTTVIVEDCKRRKIMYNDTLANGIIYMPLGPGPVRVEYINKTVNKEEKAEFTFLYPNNDPTFLLGYSGNAARWVKLSGLLNNLQSDTVSQLEKIVITGSDSPTGSQNYNENLAKKRAENFYNFLKKQKQVNPEKIKTRFITENWQKLREILLRSSKSEIHALANKMENADNNNERENFLRQSPDYKYIADTIFPELRNVTVEVYYTTRKKVQEIIPE